jgi:hypothetical protein
MSTFTFRRWEHQGRSRNKAGVVELTSLARLYLRGGGARTAITTRRFGPGLRIEWTTPAGAKAASPGRQDLGLGADLNHAAALQENIEFALALMRVKSMLLSLLKRVQACKKKITLCYGALPHPVRCELGEARDPFYEHDSFRAVAALDGALRVIEQVSRTEPGDAAQT